MSALLRAGLWVSVGLAVVSLAIWTLSQFSAFHVQDDSYMFIRYADNLLASGRLTWDPDGAATYGPTSLLFLAVVVPLRAGLAEQAALCASLASLLLGLVGLAATVGLAVFGSGAPRGARLWLCALALAPLGLAAQGLGTHLTNGMDTMLAVTMTAGLIAAWVAWGGTASTGRAIALGCCGGLAFTARPDLGIYALIVPAMVALRGSHAARRTALIALIAAAIWIGAQTLVCNAYFGTPVPLSFYVKSATGSYGETFRAHWGPVAKNQALNYLNNYVVFFALIALDAVVHWRRWLAPGRALRAGVLLATVLHMTYYTFGTYQVIGFHQRFYYPTLPALAWLAACAAVDLAATIAPHLRGGTFAPAVRWLAVLGLAFLPLSTLDKGYWEIRRESRAGRMLSFDLLDRYRRQSADFWLGLDRMIDMPDALVIATTEVGHPAALLPRKRIVDLAGLNETEFAMHGFSAERLFTVLRPDFIYMPHPDYREMSDAIRANPRFLAEYVCYDAADLGSRMGVALWRKSPYFERLARIVADARTVQH